MKNNPAICKIENSVNLVKSKMPKKENYYIHVNQTYVKGKRVGRKIQNDEGVHVQSTLAGGNATVGLLKPARVLYSEKICNPVRRSHGLALMARRI